MLDLPLFIYLFLDLPLGIHFLLPLDPEVSGKAFHLTFTASPPGCHGNCGHTTDPGSKLPFLRLTRDSRQAMLVAPWSQFLLICILSASPFTFGSYPFSSRKTRLLANHFSDHRALSPGNFGLLSITKVFKES